MSGSRTDKNVGSRSIRSRVAAKKQRDEASRDDSTASRRKIHLERWERSGNNTNIEHHCRLGRVIVHESQLDQKTVVEGKRWSFLSKSKTPKREAFFVEAKHVFAPTDIR
ncbi:hypothetical protein HN011_011612 [Eciton burchellii]|nr:hypothetical protein HN011_011612 [Eciton burchellii]